MKTRTFPSILVCLFLFMFITGSAFANIEKDGDKTLSPYFFVQSDDPETDRLPLKSTSVDVNISGVIADVIVTQVYKNEGTRLLEAIYVFPGSTKAAVYGMKMQVGERTIEANIKKREEARQEYEQAKQNGQSASLLEQHRPNVFQMNVANILPKDVIKVELRYTELLVPTDAVYEFVYPTVVGPRYVGGEMAENTTETWTANPYLQEGELPSTVFDITAGINAGLPIQDITCHTHNVGINYTGKNSASVTLDPSEKHSANRDYILKYRLAGGKIETGMLLYEGEKENFFLIMMQPPKRVKPDHIPPRDYMFIVDVSGSMNGFPLDISKKLLKDLISGLRPKDRFNVLLFAGGSTVMSEQSMPATKENIQKAIDVIDRQRGGGGTNLLPALKKALAMKGTEEYSRNIVIATDGYVTVEEQAFDLIRKNLGNANMFTFGIGSSVNRHLIEGMARIGMGEPFVLTHPDQAKEKAGKFRKLIESPVLTNIDIDYKKFKVYDVEPPSIPDVLAERPVIVFGKYKGKPKEKIVLKGTSGEKTYKNTINVSAVKPTENNSALRYLWARHRIAVLADYNRLRPNDERVQEVTNLGLTYNLLTAYTSFIAIDKEKRVVDGQPVTVKQPLPLPHGVSNYAVGYGGFYANSGKKCRKSMAVPAPTSKYKAGEYTVHQEVKQVHPGTSSDSVEGDKLTEAETPMEEKVEQTEVGAKEDIKMRMSIKIDEIDVKKGIPETAISRLLNKYMEAINRCFVAASGKQGIPKKLKVMLTVDKTGKIIKVKTGWSFNKNKHLEKCLRKLFKSLTFPTPGNDDNAEVAVTFVRR